MTDEEFSGRIPIRVRQKEKNFLRKIVLAVMDLPQIDLINPLNLPDKLEASLIERYHLNSFKAARRLERYLVGLLREVDPAHLEALQHLIDDPQKMIDQIREQVEVRVNRLLNGENPEITDFVNDFPSVNTQKLRQLVRNAKKNQGTNKTASFRDLVAFVSAFYP